MSTPLYQLVENAVLERLEDRITANGLRFYAFEQNRLVEVPAIIVGAVTGAENPPNSPIYDVEVSATLRAEINDGFTRETFGAVHETMRCALNDTLELASGLTTGRLKCYGAEFEEEDEQEQSGQVIERTILLKLMCTTVATPAPATPNLATPDPPAAGYYVSPSGLSTNAGTSDSPWDFVSALNGTQTIEAGSTIWFKAGYYSAKWGTTGRDSRYFVALLGTSANPILIKPEVVSGAKVHARVDGRFDAYAGSSHVHIYDIDFHQTTAIPAAEPTSSGSNPPELDEWGAVGAYVNEGDGWKLINCSIRGRNATGMSTYSGASNLEVYGCTFQECGWLGSDRAHGHAAYWQNTSTAGPTGASTKTLKHCFLGTQHGATNGGQYTWHVYTEGGFVDNITLDSNFCVGAATFKSLNTPVKGANVTGNVVTAARITTVSSSNEGLACGAGTFDNTDLVFTDNILVNTTTRVRNGKWTTLTMSGVTLYKTSASWWGTAGNHSTPALALTETLTFSDVSDGSGTDQYKVWLNTYDANRAHVVILALDTDDNVVAVNPSTLLTSGDTYEIFRWPGTRWDAAAYSGTWTSGTINLTLSDTTQRCEGFILIKT